MLILGFLPHGSFFFRSFASFLAGVSLWFRILQLERLNHYGFSSLFDLLPILSFLILVFNHLSSILLRLRIILLFIRLVAFRQFWAFQYNETKYFGEEFLNDFQCNFKGPQYGLHESLEWPLNNFHLDVAEAVFWSDYVADGAEHEKCDSAWENAGYNGNYNELATDLHYACQENQRRDRECQSAVEDYFANIEVRLLDS